MSCDLDGHYAKREIQRFVARLRTDNGLAVMVMHLCALL